MEAKKNSLKAEIFNLRKFEDFEKFYPIVEKWWMDWQFNPILPENLSTIGIMINSDAGYICAGWLYQTDSAMCTAGWFISTKDKKDKELRKEAINFLIKNIEEMAKRLGYGLIKISTANINLQRKIEELQYMTDVNVISYLKKL